MNIHNYKKKLRPLDRNMVGNISLNQVTFRNIVGVPKAS